MSILATLKTFWAANSTLQTALPISKVYLDLVPERTAFPYARLSVIAGKPELTTGPDHIEAFTYQLTLFHTSLDTLSTLADTIAGVLDQSRPTAGTLLHRRTNHQMTSEVVNGVYTYSVLIEYEWSYNSTGL